MDNGVTFSDVTDAVVEKYFDETIPLKTYTPSESLYTIPSSDKYGNDYSFKVIGLDASKNYRIVNEDNSVIRADITEIVSGEKKDIIVKVSGISADLKFRLQSGDDESEYTAISDLSDITVGRYFEQIVTKDKNASAARLEYFPKDVVTETVKKDTYDNPIGYEDTTKEGYTYTSTNGFFTIPESNAFDGNSTVLVKGLPLTVTENEASHSCTYSVEGTDVTMTQRPSGLNTVDLLVSHNGEGEFTFTVKRTVGENTSAVTGTITAVRFFVSNGIGIVKLPVDSAADIIGKYTSEHLAYGTSSDASSGNNGNWEKYYYTVVECDKQGWDDQSSLEFSQSETGEKNLPIAKKLSFDLNTNIVDSAAEERRKHLNIKIVDTPDDSTVQRDINGNALKLTLTSFAEVDPETRLDGSSFYTIETDKKSGDDYTFYIRDADSSKKYRVVDLENNVLAENTDGIVISAGSAFVSITPEDPNLALVFKVQRSDDEGNTYSDISPDISVKIVKDYYASDDAHNVPTAGVFVIPVPWYCDTVHCEVDGLPYGTANADGTGWGSGKDYDVKRCKSSGADNTKPFPSSNVSVTASQYVNPSVNFSYTKSWDKSAAHYGLRPDNVYFDLMRRYESSENEETVMHITKTVNADVISDNLTDNGEPDNLPLYSGKIVHIDGIGDVWRPYSYYLTEYDGEYDSSAETQTRNEKSYNNQYSSEHTYDPDKPFVLNTATHTYADLTQGLKNKLQKTTHEVIKVWDDENNASESRDNYKLQLQCKTSSTDWQPVDLTNVTVRSVNINEEDNIKEFSGRITDAAGTDVYMVPYEFDDEEKSKLLHYRFDALPVYDANGLEYSYRVVEKSIGDNDVIDNKTYLFFVPGTTENDEDFSYVRMIRRGTENYYVDYAEDVKSEYTDPDGIIHTENGEKFTAGSYSETIITNSIATDTVSFTNFETTKVWDDKDNVYGKRPQKITYVLRRNKTLNGVSSIDDTFASKKEGNESNNWVVKWNQCAAFAPDGGKFEYYVTENTVDYYTTVDVSEEKADKKVYKFTNTYKPEPQDLKAVKEWDDKSDLYGLRPEKITYELYCKYDIYDRTIAADAQGNPTVQITKREQGYDGRVYDPEAEDQSEVYKLYLSMNGIDESLGSNPFKKELSAEDKDGDDTDKWKVEFEKLPAYVNTCGDGRFLGQSSKVTYYIVEKIDNGQVRAIYNISEDGKLSNERDMFLYGQEDSTKTFTANGETGLFTVSKEAVANGELSVLIKDLPVNDIYGNKYVYTVNECDSGGSAITVQSGTPTLECEESPFHNAVSDSVSLIVSKDMPVVYFKLMRKAGSVGTLETVTKNKNDDPLAITIDNKTYKPDAEGCYAIPKNYVNCDSATEADRTSLTLTIPQSELPAKNVGGYDYTYSVVEYGKTAEGYSKLDTQDITVTKSGSGDNAVYTVKKSLGTDATKLYFKLYRSVPEESVVRTATNAPLYITVDGSSYNPTNGLYSIPKNNLGGYALQVSASGLPEKDGSNNAYTYYVKECDENGNDIGELTSSKSGSDNNVTLTITKPVDEDDTSAKVRFRVYRTVEDNNIEGPLTSNTHEKLVVAEKNLDKYEASPDSCIITVPKNHFENSPVLAFLHELPAKAPDGSSNTYTAVECNANGDALTGASEVITKETVSNDGTLTSLLFKKDYYFKLYRSVEGGSEELVSMVNGKYIKAVVNDIHLANGKTTSYKLSADTHGCITVSQFYVKENEGNYYVTFDIPDLPREDSSGRSYTYTIKEYSFAGTYTGDAPNLNAEPLNVPNLTSAFRASGDTAILTVTKQVSGALPDNIYFKLKQNNDYVYKVKTSEKALTASKFVVSAEKLTGSNVLSVHYKNEVSVTNSIETKNITVALDWFDNDYDTYGGHTDSLHYPVTASLAIDPKIKKPAQATATTVSRQKDEETETVNVTDRNSYTSDEKGIITIPYYDTDADEGKKDNHYNVILPLPSFLSEYENRKVVEFNITGLPKEKTKGYITTKYNYEVIPYDSEGNALSGNNYNFDLTINDSGTTYSLNGKSYIPVTGSFTPPEKLYFKILVSARFEMSRVITVSMPGSDIDGNNINITIPDLPKYSGEPHDAAHTYTYSVRKYSDAQDMGEDDQIGEAITPGSTADGDDKVKLTFSTDEKNLHFKVYRKDSGSTDETVSIDKVLMDGAEITPDSNGMFSIPRGNGVEFAEVPVYGADGNKIGYVVSEAPMDTFDNLTRDKKAEIYGYQIYNLYSAVENDNINYQTSGGKVNEHTPYTEGDYFEVGTDDRHYSYQGTAQAYKRRPANSNPSTSSGACTRSGVPEFDHVNILNTLPLTSVKVEKHWIDQNNKYELRPDGINDVNKNGTKNDKLNLTIYRGIESDYINHSHNADNVTWERIPSSYGTNDARYGTESYTTVDVKSTEPKNPTDTSNTGNEWYVTCMKLLYSDKNNDPYIFKIEEEKLNPYREPQYCSVNDYSDTLPVNDKQVITNVTPVAVTPDSDETQYDGLHPLTEKFEITNKLDTRDILVTKDWNDNYYGQETIANDNITVSDLSKNLHYNTAMKLEGADLPAGTAQAKVLSKIDSDAGKGVVFKDMPIYDKNRTVIDYKVTESKDGTTAAASGEYIAAPGDTNWTETGDDAYYTGDPTDAADTEFVQLTKADEGNNDDFQDYGYEGAAKKYTKTVTITEAVNNEPAVTATYPTRFHITDTLPLTSVKAEKHWDDQSDKFVLRPAAINDKNKSESASNAIDLTLSRKSGSGTYGQIYPVTALTNNANKTEWYTGEKVIPVSGQSDEWTYTYKKLLKYDIDNNAYNFKITEDQVKGYKAPQYCAKASFNATTPVNNKQTITSVDTLSSGTTWDGNTPLKATFEITNKLDTRDIKVYKHWEDNGNPDTHYSVDFTLSSTYQGNQTANNASVSSTFTRTENAVIRENETDEYAVFTALPKYDANGAVIVYNVREEAHTKNASPHQDSDLGSDKITAQSSSTALGTIPTFKNGDRHYGYVLSKAEYKTDTEDGKTYATEYHVTNTLPVTKIKATKSWDEQFDQNLNKYANTDVTFTLTSKDSSEGADYTAFVYSSPLTFQVERSTDNGANYSLLTGEITALDTNHSTDNRFTTETGKFTIPLTAKYDGEYKIGILLPASSVSESYTYRITDISGGGNAVVTQLDTPPGSVAITLTASEKHKETVKYSNVASPLNYAEFVDLPVYDNANKAYSYKVEETAIKGYNVSYSTDNSTFTASDNTVTADESHSSDPFNIYVKNTQILGNATFIKIDKTDYDAHSTHDKYTIKRLPDAEFELTYRSGTVENPVYTNVNVIFDNTEGCYVIDESNGSNKVVSDSNGEIKFKDLPLNTYRLKETQAPTGFTVDEGVALPECEFTIDVASAEAATADVHYDSGFITGNEIYKNCIGNLQHVETTRITLVKMDASDHNKRLPNATYYLLRLKDFDYYGSEYNNPSEYESAAKNAIKYAIENDLPNNGGALTDGIRKFWNTSSDLNGSHIPYIYTTDENGMIGPITSIMNGTYIFLEAKAPEGYELSYSDPFEISDTEKVVRVEHFDLRKSGNVDVLKVNEYDDPLDGAEFELYYKGKAAKPNYQINSKVVAPTPPATEYTVGNFDTLPTNTYTPEPTYTYSYTYSALTPPENTVSNWILPRTDNDYIYFKDSKPLRGYSINTAYGSNQNDSNYKMTLGDLFIWNDGIIAQFYDSSHQLMKDDKNPSGQIGVWERFVNYDNDSNRTQDIVWKVQPPDGAKYVEFSRGWDKNEETTGKFEFTKGMMYYSSDRSDNWIEANNTNPNGEPIGRKDDKTANQSGIAYEPTANKLVFRRNSKYCWDNLHVEFFRDVETGETADYIVGDHGYKIIGEQFPGYLMEPYGHAASNYRIWFDDNEAYNEDNQYKYGNLCYEITIPKNAKYFRINNGTVQTDSSGDYKDYGKYYTEIKQLNTDANRKNAGNYWKLQPNNGNGLNEEKTNVRLANWSYDEIVNKAKDSYWKDAASFEVDSDSDFIYFKKPAYWRNNVYAYFYGGGDLRENNWQRAVYSIWPGIIPNDSKVNPSPTEGGFKDNINNNFVLSPDSTYKDKNGDTIFKFRKPLGDDTLYHAVIFNDGLVGTGNRSSYHETKMHDATGGNGYTETGSWTQTATPNETTTYEFRNANDDDYIYIINKSGSGAWDDIHIKFYDAGGNSILQGGNGYVMKYAGSISNGDASANGDYYRVPVPKNAVKFALNNGNSSYNTNRYTEKYDILKYHATKEENGYTKGSQIFAIEGNAPKYSLKQVSPIITEIKTANDTSITPNDTDYTVRTHIENSAAVPDYLYIKDSVSCITSPVTVKFYDVDGNVIGSKEYVPTQMAQYEGKTWYRKEIPVNAVEFSLSTDSHIKKFAIYEQGERSTEKNFTSGNMVYETVSGTDILSLIYPADNYYTSVHPAGFDPGTPTDDFDNVGTREDMLYLVTANENSWPNLKVVYYDKNGSPIGNNIGGQEAVSGSHLGNLGVSDENHAYSAGVNTAVADAQGEWYSFHIPENAASFKVIDNDGNSTSKESDTTYPILKLRNNIAPKRNNYTLGDMQYRIADTGTNNKYKLTAIYPVFTEAEEVRPPSDMDDIGSPTLSNLSADDINRRNGVPLTRYADVEQYSKLGIAEYSASIPSAPADTPVLYQTDTNNIIYEWEDGQTNENYNYIRFVDKHEFNNTAGRILTAYFFDGESNTAKVVEYDSNMVAITQSGHSVYKFLIPEGNYNKVIFSNRHKKMVIIGIYGLMIMMITDKLLILYLLDMVIAIHTHQALIVMMVQMVAIKLGDMVYILPIPKATPLTPG